ncbi:MAG: sulfatase [Candidatus Brocadiaceae bacterium]|nr:sulfatase [Candidatus Brocadiaceae bacterium]
MPTIDIIKEVSMIVLLASFVSAGIGFLLAGIVTLVGIPFQKTYGKTNETVYAVVNIAILAISLVFLLQLLRIWLQQVTGVIFVFGATKPLVLLLIIILFVFMVWKFNLQAVGNLIQYKLAKGNKAVLVLIALSGSVVALNGIVIHDYDEIKSSQNSSPSAGMPNVILLSIDTLTAEDMSLYGYHLPTTTPRLEAFAKASYVFDNFFSSSNWTTPSVASFISGLYPSTHGVNQHASYFLEEDRKKNLAQILKDNGYQSAAIVANGAAHPLSLMITDSFSAVTEKPVRGMIATSPISKQFFRVKNYGKHIDVWSEVFELILVTHNEENSLFPPELVFNRTLPFFSSLQQPMFVWAHILPPHSPYLPASPFKYQFGNFNNFSTLYDLVRIPGNNYPPQRQPEVEQLRLRYDEFVLDTDSQVGDFLEKLKAMGRFDDSIIIVTADHGESFTKGYWQHGGTYLHQPLIHVPMMIHLPGQREGKRIASYAGQVDLLPTVIDLLNLPIPTWVEGESLKSSMLEGKPTIQPKFSMNLEMDSRFVPPSKGTFAVMQEDWKLVRYLATGKEELYHLASDPKEGNNLIDSNPEKAKKMRELIYAHFKLNK